MPQYYGVWVGRKPGIYDNWDDCKAQVDKFPGSKFQKLKNVDYVSAVHEYNLKNGNYPKIVLDENIRPTIIKDESPKKKDEVTKSLEASVDDLMKNPSFNDKFPQKNVLTVDGASNGVNCEFRAVWYPSGEEVFASKKYAGGTNNIAEFLGLVFTLKHLMKNKLPLNVYSDSVTAMAWYRDRKANTTANQTGKGSEELNRLLEDAEKFLRDNKAALAKANVMKWHTAKWGEIPADYGRKGSTKSRKPKF